MTDAARTIAAEEHDLPTDMIELVHALERLPDEHRRFVDPLLANVLASTRRRRRILRLVQEALGQLRLDMKYLMFDLEATRRERDDFRRQLEGEVGGPE